MKCPDFCKKVFETLGLIVIGGNLFLIGMVIYWLLQTPKVSTVVVPIEILNENNEIAIGDPIKMKIELSKPVNADHLIDSSVTITCNDGNLITLDSVTRNLPSGDRTVINDSYLLPPKALIGTDCTFNFKNVYRVNPIKSAETNWKSEVFKVTE